MLSIITTYTLIIITINISVIIIIHFTLHTNVIITWKVLTIILNFEIGVPPKLTHLMRKTIFYLQLFHNHTLTNRQVFTDQCNQYGHIHKSDNMNMTQYTCNKLIIMKQWRQYCKALVWHCWTSWPWGAPTGGWATPPCSPSSHSISSWPASLAAVLYRVVSLCPPCRC